MRRLGHVVLTLVAASCASVPSVPPLESIVRTVGIGEGPVVVFLHGYASTPESFVSLADRTDLPAGTVLVFPRAPLSIRSDPDARMWWPMPLDFGEIPRRRMPGMNEARERTSALLDVVLREHPGRPLILGGFSQGAMVSLDVALHDPRPLAGLVLLSGTMIDEHDTLSRLDRLAHEPIYVSHGTSDRVLRYEDDLHLVELMREHGADVHLSAFPGGHTVTPAVSTEVAAFITRCASAP